MSNIVPIKNAIDAAKGRFLGMKEAADLDWQAESLFALQACSKNEYAMKTALNNPLSLKMAMANVAAIGLTLNPARGLAYLVPRDNKIVLDISYRGLIQLAVQAGTIKWAKAEIVHQNDTFEYLGVDEKPKHQFDPFGDRGPLVGVYCVAKLADGTYLTEVMTLEQIEQVRKTSKAKKGPWVIWYEEMAKKAVIKRASKTWPQVSPQFVQAVQVLNEHEGLAEEYQADGPEAQECAPVEPLPDDEVPDDARELTAKVIARAAKSDAWAAAKDYIEDRYKSDPPLAAWALERLAEAQPAAEDTGETSDEAA